jgi:hypothetical protein
MVTYILICKLKRVVLLETDSIELLRAFVDQKIEISRINTVEIIIDSE